jgi:hypothetical protein
MNNINKNYRALAITALLLLVQVATMVAQCPMCKMSAESNMKNGGTAGAGLNAGIMYMLVAPYLIVAAGAYWWWRNRRTEEEQGAGLPSELLKTEDSQLN